ncbi:hypothetical protein [Alteribacillus sp. HJP-4]|uniref:hypothetical protein n=1 Tax=Alteribacillus sp. HJP-4 TaxID=2775394 RepID=UPI0035CCD768
MAEDIGTEMSQEVLKHGAEVAASYSIDVAKDKLKEKYGSSIAAKVTPYLAFFAWSYTAVDVFSTVGKGLTLSTLASAANDDEGLIYEESRSTGDTSKWYRWDDDSPYGSYPYAKLGPNKYQYGDVEKH